MVLQQSKFFIKCHKSKYFCMIFHPIKYYQNQNLNFNYVTEITTSTIFKINFFKILHFILL